MPEASCIICLKELYLLPESYCVVCPKWKVLQYHASTSSNSLHNLTYFGTCNRETKLPKNYVWQIDFYNLTHLKVINQWYVLLGDLFYNMLECKTHKNLNDFSRYIIKYNTIFLYSTVQFVCWTRSSGGISGGSGGDGVEAEVEGAVGGQVSYNNRFKIMIFVTEFHQISYIFFSQIFVIFGIIIFSL